MRIKYEIGGISLFEKAHLVSDLVQFYGRTRFKTIEKLNKIKKNRGLSAHLLNSIRKRANITGLTIDGLIHNLNVASEMEFFNFKVDDFEPSKIFNDNRDIVVEIYMNPVIFSTNAALTMYMPSIHKKRKNLEIQTAREKQAWMGWLGKQFKGYDLKSIKKSIIEE